MKNYFHKARMILCLLLCLPIGHATADSMKVAIIAPSAQNDLAFTQSIVDGINALKDEYSLEVAITDGTFVVEDAAAAIRDYAKQGYGLVIAHGSQYGGSLKEIAGDFPDTAFAWGTAADTFGLPNVSAYEAMSNQGGYVMGAMAAAMSKSGTIGVVGPIEVGDAKKINANVNYIGSFSDVALSAEAGTAHIANGADVLTGTAQMVVGAVGAARKENIAWFGTQANQTKLGPKIVVASQVYKWEVVLKEIFESVKSGNKGGEVHKINLANGGIQIEFNDDYPLDDSIRKVGETAMNGIKDGSITLE